MKLPFALLMGLTALTPAAGQQLQSITGTELECINGHVRGFSCNEVTLLSRIIPAELGDANYLNDVWGWADPSSGREFALVGTFEHVAFVEVTDPLNPEYIGLLPSQDWQSTSVWRDMKVYKDHMFVVVDGAGRNGMQIFDLSRLLSPPTRPYEFDADAHYDRIGRAHNIVINEATGFAYAVGSRYGNYNDCSLGLHMIDIRDPLKPKYAGCYRDYSTGRGSSGYTHDAQCVIYDGPDTDHAGREICIGFNENAISIADVTDKAAPVAIARSDYPDVSYAHQGWLTPDHRYVVQNDELDERNLLRDGGRGEGTRTLIWDVEDLDDPVILTEYWGQARSIDHNLYVAGQYVYMANYTSGLRILDVADPATPQEVAYFDTHPENDDLRFWGAWTAYPFLPSGTVLVSSSPEGLFMLSTKTLGMPAALLEAPPGSFMLHDAYPNPFNPVLNVSLSLLKERTMDVRVFDTAGREIAVLHTGELTKGRHRLAFDAGNLVSGTYFIRASSGAHAHTLPVALVR